MSRNELCACGSGKRFKHCHGAIEAPAPPSALHFEALAAHRSGSLTQAETLYRRAIERNPGDADSLHMLGVVQFERLRYREALELMWSAGELTAWSDVTLRQNLGLVLAKLLSPRANARQRDFVAAYVARERDRKASAPIAALVSVVLTAGSGSRLVPRAMASVVRQTYRDIEVIVVDDSSTDEIARIVDEGLSGVAFPVRIVDTDRLGEARAANEGARRAEGRYLAFLRASEWFAPNRVERMVAEISRAAPMWGYSRVGYSGNDSSGDSSGQAGGNAISPARDIRSNELASFALLRRNASESSGNLFIDRDLFHAIGGYRDVGENSGWDLGVRAARIAEPVAVEERLYFRDERGDLANPAAGINDRFAAALVLDAMNGDGAASNPFSPHFPGNRDLLLRAELRAGRGDRLPIPMLRSLAAEWRERAPARATPGRHATAQPSVAKTALVVLGVYRSGTSAIARVLNLCGAFLPAAVVAEDLLLNPKGFWETEGVNDLDARLLHHLGAEWNRVDFDLPREGPLIDEFLANSRELLGAEYGDAPLILIKDPRIGVLAPLWHRSLQECGYRPAYVVAVRNPLEVARSFEAHGDMPIADGLALWLAYMRRIETFVDDGYVDAVHVRYTELLDDWRSVVRRIARRLDLRLAVDGCADEVDQYLDAALRKHRATEADLEPHLAGPTGEATGALYRRLLARCERDAAEPRATGEMLGRAP